MLPTLLKNIFRQVTSTCHFSLEVARTFESCSDYNYHVKKYKFKGNAQSAFKKLLTLSPAELWKSTSRFELEYDPASKKFIGKDQELPPVAVGQLFFLELDIVKNMRIPVGFEVVELNTKTRTIAFSYLKHNKSQGIQRIHFVQDGEDFKIVHETRFKSDSKFRDQFLYGPFHTKLLNVFWDDFGKHL